MLELWWGLKQASAVLALDVMHLATRMGLSSHIRVAGCYRISRFSVSSGLACGLREPRRDRNWLTGSTRYTRYGGSDPRQSEVRTRLQVKLAT